MPIYEFQAATQDKCCEYCSNNFEQIMRISDPPVLVCPRCGNPVVKQISAPSVGASKSGFDARAKAGGFHKLQKLSKGEYEKVY